VKNFLIISAAMTTGTLLGNILLDLLIGILRAYL